MRIFADLQLHSHYSRATSKDMNLENLEKFGKIKGLNLIGTGDLSHPLWFAELKSKLKEIEGTNLFHYRDKDVYFMLTGEVSLVYEQDKMTRKVHHMIFAPSFEIANQINEALGKRTNLSVDGRPIINNYSSPNFAEEMMQISKDIVIIPAHCLLPNEKIICNPEIKPISNVKIGNNVLTHTGTYKKVQEVYTRQYTGKVYKIIPYYFAQGTKVTEEHPFLAIKTVKKCTYVGGLCKPNSISSGKHKCKEKHFEKYKPLWVPAENLEVNDVLLYPRPNETIDLDKIEISDIIGDKDYKIREDLIVPKFGAQYKYIKNTIRITPDFCRLIGYYLAEGYLNKRNNCLQFSFNVGEEDYIRDVRNLIKEYFNVSLKKIRKRNGYELYFYSKPMVKFFEKLFYQPEKENKAPFKRLPDWVLYLPKYKQIEIFRGWWRGDTGVSTSEILASQMKLICLRLGIVPSIHVTLKEKYNSYKSEIGGRLIVSYHDTFTFHNLSFYEDPFNLLQEPEFKKFKTKLSRRHGWIDENYIFIPIRKIETFEYSGLVYNLEVEEDNSYVTTSATVHNCMTPWFGIFGSKSGFNSVEECFQDKSKYIFAVETGLSADPKMLWRVSAFEKYAFVSNSDAHSPWPSRIGREANVFELENISYKEVFDAIKKKDKERFLFTIEVNPAYGKYHLDGHRNCKVCLEPKESMKYKDYCPVCRKKLTVGVLHRIEELADREEGFVPDNAIPFKNLIPLSELAAATYNVEVYSKKVWEESTKLTNAFGSEFKVLLEVPKEKLRSIAHEKLAEVIIENREGKLKIQPGYDGVYGKVVLDETISYRQPQMRLDSY